MNSEIKALADYFDSRASDSDNSSYVNGYSGDNQADVDSLYTLLFDEICQIADIGAADRVLDVGCGTGELLWRIKSVAPNCQGLDISPQIVEMAIKRGLEVQLYDGNVMPFEPATFDRIIIQGVLINLPHLTIAERLVRESYRLLKPGGRLFIGNIPHPQKSGFISHTEKVSTIKRIKIILKNMLGLKGESTEISYYSYEYQIFTNLFDELNFKDMGIHTSQLQIKSFMSKYHVTFLK